MEMFADEEAFSWLDPCRVSIENMWCAVWCGMWMRKCNIAGRQQDEKVSSVSCNIAGR